MKRVDTVLYVLCTVLLVVTVGLLIYETVGSLSRMPKRREVILGTVTYNNYLDYPGVFINSRLCSQNHNFPLALTCMQSVFTSPSPVSSKLFLESGTIPEILVCNTFTAGSVQRSNTFSFCGQDFLTGKQNVPALMGVGKAKDDRGVFVSPFLQKLVELGYGGSWCFSERLKECAVYPGVLSLPCTNWTWTPLLPGELYALALKPTAGSPWTTAVVDVGRWASVMPGADPNTLQVVETSTGMVFTAIAFDSSSVLVPLPNACILGASALVTNRLCCFDVANSRFGVNSIYIGDVLTKPTAYVF
jgi:hypothetical protein